MPSHDNEAKRRAIEACPLCDATGQRYIKTLLYPEGKMRNCTHNPHMEALYAATTAYAHDDSPKPQNKPKKKAKRRLSDAPPPSSSRSYESWGDLLAREREASKSQLPQQPVGPRREKFFEQLESRNYIPAYVPPPPQSPPRKSIFQWVRHLHQEDSWRAAFLSIFTTLLVLAALFVGILFSTLFGVRALVSFFGMDAEFAGWCMGPLVFCFSFWAALRLFKRWRYEIYTPDDVIQLHRSRRAEKKIRKYYERWKDPYA